MTPARLPRHEDAVRSSSGWPSFAGPWGVFQYVDVPGGSGPAYKLFTVAEVKQPLKVSGGLTVLPDFSFGNAPMPDVVVVPALGAAPSPAVLAWLKKVSAHTELTMSVCTGAFVLAAAGSSTASRSPRIIRHWACSQGCRKAFQKDPKSFVR